MKANKGMNLTLSDFRKTENSFAVKRASAGMTPLTERPE
jgi:hypothetical protein